MDPPGLFKAGPRLDSGRARWCHGAVRTAALILACAAGMAFDAPSRGETPSDPGISRTPDGRAVIHRRIPDPGGAHAGEAAPVFVYDPVGGGTLPQEFRRDGQAMPRPAPGAEASPGEAVYSPDGVTDAAPESFSSALGGVDPSLPPVTGPPGTAGDPTGPPTPGGPDSATGPGGPTFEDPRLGLGDIARPDRVTTGEERLDYRTVFDPSIVPFKRNRALDEVDVDYSLKVERRGFVRLAPIGNRLDPGHEAFWGSVLVDARAGQRVPLPSVSPESRILSYEATPPVGLVFEKDGADNFYVTPDATGRVRVVFVMDAPAGYFGRQLPTGLTPRDVPARLRPHPPAAIAREAVAVARLAGIDPAAPYDVVLNSLVGYFRAFEPGEPPPSASSIYRDLALGHRGVCRHRGYAFVVTAQGLGIPARYVFNEAHVFVEVFVPGPNAGWMRVDLGGGAERLVVHGGDDKVLHRPRTRDPFDRPEAYARGEMAGHTAGAVAVEGMPAASRRDFGTAGGSVDPDALPEAIRALLNRNIPRAPPPPPGSMRTLTRTSMAFDRAFVFRGEPVIVGGRVLDARGDAVTNGSVQVLLLYGRNGRAVALLGTALVDGEGRYAAEVRIPERQPPGDYDIVAEYMGTATWAPSVSP